jgi:L-ascorbate metabolism protein UlaG (beta-lactamase superfamily)
MKLSGIKIT